MEFYTVEEVAKRLSTSEAYIKKLLRQGKLSCVKLGHFVRIPVASFEAFLQANTQAAGEKPAKKTAVKKKAKAEAEALPTSTADLERLLRLAMKLQAEEQSKATEATIQLSTK